jgi:uncharacterized protein (DUF433 family)
LPLGLARDAGLPEVSPGGFRPGNINRLADRDLIRLVSSLRFLENVVTPMQSVVHSHPGILGGIPVFVGTRVPVKNLFDYLEAGDRLEDFLDAFPSVSRDQAIAALELAEQALTAGANPPR